MRLRATSLGLESVLGIVALIGAVVAHHVTADDQWTYVLTGRLILDHLRIPHTDSFSFTFDGQPWVTWEWLGGVVLAFAWDLGGVPGLYALRLATVGIAVCVLVAVLQRERVDRPTTCVLFVGLFILCLQPRVGDRPYMWGFPCLALTLLWGRSVVDRPTWPGFFRLFVLLLAWVGLHPSSTLGLVLVGTLAVERVLADWRADGARAIWAQHRARLLVPVGLATAALTSPNLPEYGHKLSVILSRRVSGEWSSLAEHLTHGHPWVYVYGAIVTALVGTVILDRAARRSPLTWLAAALAVYAYVYSRFVAVFAVVALPAIYGGVTRRLRLVEGFELTSRAVRVAILGVTAWAVNLETQQVYDGFDIALDPRTNPIAQADFMERHGMKGRVFAPTRGANAYLSMRLWPEVKIFIDGRVPQLFPTDFADEHAAASDPRRFVELAVRYDFDHVVIPGGLLSRVGRHWGKVLQQSGGFRLVHFDEHGMVWSRIRATGLACERCRPFNALQPWRIDGEWARRIVDDHGFAAVADEVGRLAKLEGARPLATSMVSALLHDGGLADIERARLSTLLDAQNHE